ncbi:TPA: hypothetical protein KQW67_003707 [Clostridioides difficile]|nr:hypothetical protein [Clostridioides difficile]
MIGITTLIGSAKYTDTARLMRNTARLMLKDLKQGHVTKLVQDSKGQLLHAGLSLKEYRGLALRLVRGPETGRRAF